jgi:hypothetical protein
MLNQIVPAKTEDIDKEENAIDMLLGCHQRIRHFGGMAMKLVAAQETSPRQIELAAESLLRYFTVALPLHEADENDSIHPRLRHAAPEGTLAGSAADAMVEQHRSIDEIVERLIPLWELLRGNPGMLAEVSNDMGHLAKTLETMFGLHLKLEEETVFPAMQHYLSQAELNEITKEMRERRK